MEWRQWQDLPAFMQNRAVETYYEVLSRKRLTLKLIRVLDILLAGILLFILLLPGMLIGFFIVLDSAGPVFFVQRRVTQYGRVFHILKFRTMYEKKRGDPENLVGATGRVSTVGGFLRRYRLDEIPQLINILAGDMSFVGTRPEVEKFVSCYTEEMSATLLLPAGLTSRTSIRFRNEEQILEGSGDPDADYIQRILPEKMKSNLSELRETGLSHYFSVLYQTISQI